MRANMPFLVRILCVKSALEVSNQMVLRMGVLLALRRRLRNLDPCVPTVQMLLFLALTFRLAWLAMRVSMQ